MKASLLFTCALVLAAPALAQDPLAPLPEGADPAPASQEATRVTPPAEVAKPVAAPVRVPKNWREVFTAIRSQDWAAASAGIAALPRDLLTPVARAELYTARNSPVVGLAQLESLLAEAPELPQAAQLARMAVIRGAKAPPPVAAQQRIEFLGSAPGRSRAQPVSGDPALDQLRAAIDPLLEADDAAAAEVLLMQAAPALSLQGRAETGQRVAWTYYRIGRDSDARRVADAWRAGIGGDWGAHSAWVAALASWRLNDCETASSRFREVASLTGERELRAGAYYWAARAEQACRRPRSVAPLLKAAAQSQESFYGLVAREALGQDKALPPDPHSHAARVESLPNVRRATELVAIGERALAEEFLRHQARIGRASDHHGLIEFAKRYDLAGAQFWLAHNGQRGAVADPQDRYPLPRWTPLNGWRIDPSLAFAHIRQESSFRTEAVSPAGAGGLMQVRPGTASDMARLGGVDYQRRNLADPVMNIELGQSFIERMRASAATQGQLPKIVASYNAGPVPVGRWNILDRGDPLLWIESIPYWETRYYVPAVLRNLWVYQGLTNSETPALTSLVQHRWPSFPAGRITQAR